ncbi:hypothetical protein CALCODRAFT_359779 [Calocera cornea HHB12733]|uniref:Uncharacterized protein n=1 Tax=Calocera cornea HHB12733 TaxID=1353952 RepID=A0A165EMC0_9BASI|nr:hypothetical protein CALCODRAFT_359779 [Calocera cornea HHB12733]
MYCVVTSIDLSRAYSKLVVGMKSGRYCLIHVGSAIIRQASPAREDRASGYNRDLSLASWQVEAPMSTGSSTPHPSTGPRGIDLQLAGSDPGASAPGASARLDAPLCTSSWQLAIGRLYPAYNCHQLMNVLDREDAGLGMCCVPCRHRSQRRGLPPRLGFRLPRRGDVPAQVT